MVVVPVVVGVVLVGDIVGPLVGVRVGLVVGLANGADVGAPHHPWASLTGRTTVVGDDELEEDSPRFGQSQLPGSEIATAHLQTGISPIHLTPEAPINPPGNKKRQMKPGLT